MGKSALVTLFSAPPQSKPGPSPVVASMLIHGVAFSLLTMHVMAQNRVIERFPQRHFAVRVLEFHSHESQVHAAGSGGVAYPPFARGAVAQAAVAEHGESEHAGAPTATKSAPATMASLSGSAAPTRMTPQRMPAPQTLLQPDLPESRRPTDMTPVPLVVLWAPEKVAPKKIVLPSPEAASVATARPSLEMPLNEEDLADLRVSSSSAATEEPAVRPSTTSPIVVHGLEEAERVPQTTSKDAEPATPTRLLSLSDTRVAEGQVMIPLANETDKATAGNLIPGQLKGSSPMGNGASTGNGDGQSAGNGAGDRRDGTAESRAQGRAEGRAVANGIGVTTGSKTGAMAANRSAGAEPIGAKSNVKSDPGSDSEANFGSGSGNGSGARVADLPGTVHISLPKDGQFGVVVFGSTVAELYPETAEMWSGRIASTVYLRVGQPKSWILQYAPPRVVDGALGTEAHIDAPWPYEIARPTIDPADLDADVLILHGFVDREGHFEKLTVVFPAEFPQAASIENALNQWIFRPAKQGGLAVLVEVLLIIPSQSQ